MKIIKVTTKEINSLSQRINEGGVLSFRCIGLTDKDEEIPLELFREIVETAYDEPTETLTIKLKRLPKPTPMMTYKQI